MLEHKKILFFMPSLEMGGSERQALILAEHLAVHYGAQIEVWGVSGRGLLVAECERLGFPWQVLDFSWPGRGVDRLRALARLAVRLRAARPDIILPYTLLPSVACACVWRFTGAQACLWNQRDILGYRMGDFWERRAVRQASAFVVNSGHVGTYLEQMFTVPAGKIHLVQNAVAIPAPECSRDAWRQALGCTDTDLVAVMVANLHRNKAHAEVLSAWRLFLDRHASAGRTPVLALAGLKGETYAELAALVDRFRMQDSVRFPGQVDDVAGLLAAADIGVFCSRSEGSPNGVLECMAAGLPVVATDIPGVCEALGEQDGGLLSACGDVAAMAANLLRLAGSADLRARLGESNRQRIRNSYSRDEMGRKMVEIIEGCCRS